MLNYTFHCDDANGADDLHFRTDTPIGNGLFRSEFVSLRDALDGIPPRTWVRSAAERADDLSRAAAKAEERAASHVNPSSFMAEMEARFARQSHAEAAAWREITDNPNAFPHLY